MQRGSVRQIERGGCIKCINKHHGEYGSQLYTDLAFFLSLQASSLFPSIDPSIAELGGELRTTATRDLGSAGERVNGHL